MITMPIELYTDGSCLKNPGTGGYAFIIRYWDTPEGSDMPNPTLLEFKQGFRLTTNNRMEIMAGIEGIKKVIEMIKAGTLNGATQLDVYSDSEYFCNSVNQRWIDKWQENNWMTSGYRGSQPQPVKNKDLWEQVIAIRKELQSISINLSLTHIEGHAGHEFNEKADKLAVSASHDSTNHLIDTAYESTAKILNR